MRKKKQDAKEHILYDFIHIEIKNKAAAAAAAKSLQLCPTLCDPIGVGDGHGSPASCRPRGPKESDTTEQLHLHFSLSCIGEGNGNPLQCSCLENPRDGGAWWAAVYGVTQSRTQLKWLSSSSSSSLGLGFLQLWEDVWLWIFFSKFYH